jgi:hypothetical protein
MADLLQTGSDWLADQLKTHASWPVVYYLILRGLSWQNADQETARRRAEAIGSRPTVSSVGRGEFRRFPSAPERRLAWTVE